MADGRSAESDPSSPGNERAACRPVRDLVPPLPEVERDSRLPAWRSPQLPGAETCAVQATNIFFGPTLPPFPCAARSAGISAADRRWWPSTAGIRGNSGSRRVATLFGGAASRLRTGLTFPNSDKLPDTTDRAGRRPCPRSFPCRDAWAGVGIAPALHKPAYWAAHLCESGTRRR